MRKAKTDEHWIHWRNAWNEHVLIQTGMKAKFSVDDCKGLKVIRKFFLQQYSRTTGLVNTEEEALYCFQYILQNWDKLDTFKQQLKPMFIYGRIEDYIAHFQRLKGSGKMQAVETNTKSIQEKGFDYYKNL